MEQYNFRSTGGRRGKGKSLYSKQPLSIFGEEERKNQITSVSRQQEIRQSNKECNEYERQDIVLSGTCFITGFKDLLKQENNNQVCEIDKKKYMERVLHSIFFFGQCKFPPCLPKHFFPDSVLEKYNINLTFEAQKNLLPRYTPYSILLECMTEIFEGEQQDVFMKKVTDVNKSLWPENENGQRIPNVLSLKASVVTYCCVEDADRKVLQKTYGSSMSCKTTAVKEMMIALSALHVWHKAISFVVCCEGSAITFNSVVHSCAYKLNYTKWTYEKKPPCSKCKGMYHAKFDPEYEKHTGEEPWPRGNCAENESFSRLLLQSPENVIKEISSQGASVIDHSNVENKFKEKYEDGKKIEVTKRLEKWHIVLPEGEWKFFDP